MKMWKTTNPSSWFLAGMVWFINNICLTVWCTVGSTPGTVQYTPHTVHCTVHLPVMLERRKGGLETLETYSYSMF